MDPAEHENKYGKKVLTLMTGIGICQRYMAKVSHCQVS